MRILVSNDDSFAAPGIVALVAALQKIAEVTVVAPERDCSGASNSLTLDRPLRLRQSESGFYSVNGTPTDCVHLALTGLLADHLPDIVVSGVNLGQNMGDDTLYSGTVAAAMEGYLLGIPALAVSLAVREPGYLADAARVARDTVERVIRFTSAAKPWLWNINVPAVRYEALGPLQITRLGKRHRAEPVIKTLNPRNETVYWVGAAGSAADAGPGTDFHAVASGCVSITPLQCDLTHREGMTQVREWMGA